MRNQWGRAIDPMPCCSMLVNYARLYRLPHEQKEQLEHDNHYGSGCRSYCFHRGSLPRLSQTEYVQDFIKVSKLTTVQEPVKPPDPPPSEKESEPEPEVKPEPKPDPPPLVKELAPEPVVSQAPVEDQPPALSSVRVRPDPRWPVRHHSQSGKAEAGLHSMKTCSWAQFKRSTKQPADLSDSLRVCGAVPTGVG